MSSRKTEHDDEALDKDLLLHSWVRTMTRWERAGITAQLVVPHEDAKR